MKKIIYSLVIMIAAGSLFTSCIEQVEPLGIQDIRYAKAEYIRALKDLRAADAEYVRAQAAVEQANARYIDAQTAYQNSLTENQKLLNEYQQLLNEAQAAKNEYDAADYAAKIEQLKMDMEEAAAEHAIYMVTLAEAKAKADAEYDMALRDIAITSKNLSPEERVAITEAAAIYAGVYEVYTRASERYEAAVGAYNKAVNDYEAYVANGSEKWDGAKFEDIVAYYQAKIADEQENIKTYTAAKEAAPAVDADLQEWAKVLQDYDNQIHAIDQQIYQAKYDSAAYYKNYLCEGVQAFNEYVGTWVAGNWTKDGSSYYAPTAPAKNYITTNAAVLGIEPFAELRASTSAAYAKFEYLLKSYDVNSPANNWATKKHIIYVSNDSMYVTANQAMKAFVMGAADATKDSLTLPTKNIAGTKDSVTIKAMYGLNGAVSVLERDKVLNATAGSKDTAKLRKTRDAAKVAWETDRAILIAGLPEYEPYKQALEAYTSAESNASSAKGNMTKAIDTLVSAFKSVNGSSKMSTNDSVRVLDAFKAFAAAREAYLGYTFSGKGHDSTYFVYSKGKDAATSKPILDSVKFVELSLTDMVDGKYNFDAATNPGDVKYGNTTYEAAGTVGFANIANQLLGTKVAELMASVSGTGWDVLGTTANQTINNGADNTTNNIAFYKTYKWNYASEKIVDGNGNAVESSDLENAKSDVMKKVLAYVNIYKVFWGETKLTALPTDVTTAYTTYFDETNATKKNTYLKGGEISGTDVKGAEPTVAEELPNKAAAYTFDTFNTPTNVVSFVVDGSNVDWSNAIGAILGTVEVAVTGGTSFTDGSSYKNADVVDNTKTFGTSSGRTEFYKYMKAEWDYQVSLQDFDSDLAKIKAWVAKVEQAFVADAEQAGVVDAKKYQKYQQDSTKAANYQTALQAFNGKKTVPVTLASGKWTPSATYTVGDYKVSEVEDLLAKDIFGNYNGWNTTYFAAGSDLRKKAEEIFGEKVYETLQNHKDLIEKLNHQKADLADLKVAAENAYVYAAKAKDYETYGDEETIKNMQKAYKQAYTAYIKSLDNAIKDAETAIEGYNNAIAAYKNGLSDAEVKVAAAKAEMENMKLQLDVIEEGLKIAKENFETILNYVKTESQGTVVIPVTYGESNEVLQLLSDNNISVTSIISKIISFLK